MTCRHACRFKLSVRASEQITEREGDLILGKKGAYVQEIAESLTFIGGNIQRIK